MTIVAMEGMASEACDREQMYLDVLGSRDLMSKKPFTRQTECKTPQTHEPDYNIGLAETTTLMRVPLPLCPPAPRPFPTPHAPHTPHSTLKAAHDFDFSGPTTHTPLALTNTHIKSLSPCPTLSIKKEVPYHLTTDDTHTAHHLEQTLLSLS